MWLQPTLEEVVLLWEGEDNAAPWLRSEETLSSSRQE